MSDKSSYVIAVAGMGYVGLSNAVLLSQHNKVLAVDVVEERVNKINNRISPIEDKEIKEFFAEKELDLTATLDARWAYSQADYVLISTPTNYDPQKNYFDTSSVEAVLKIVKECNKDCVIVIKSTIPVGYTELISKRYDLNNVIFVPEFLREGKALLDNLFPSRIILGVDGQSEALKEKAVAFSKLLIEGALKEEIDVLVTSPTEAEAVKLFSNTYLAMRVAFFNELDTYAESRGLSAKNIISGMILDPRIGNRYNNPSFGYGGYCLPKDTKQLLANFSDVPNDIIKAIVNSNQTRKAFVTERILKKAGYPEKKDIKVGLYRLIMKADSDNFRESAIQGIMENLLNKDVNMVIYEPTLKSCEFEGIPVESSLESFMKECDVIVANRDAVELDPVREKVYTRDIFGGN